MYACTNPPKRIASWDRLSGADYVCLLKGRAELAAAPKCLLPLSAIEGDDEFHGAGCDKKKRLALLKEIRDECSGSLDVLATLRAYLEEPDFEDEVCGACSSRIKGKLANVRETLWNELPTLFYLD
ncbi:hypothetical protein BJ138DRAFT_1155041 [Hygrophoropsis aurantiaca]|uniref:Uncharacterized protein n=1 Tax=Hygrophoropsis aurantiaca TaxID=72124 RepID=A0ACB8A925_9AGAM|nr:hypothetical protein BJ138DRAFT_1155041 [Hygrophoropsis aurantiaca]